MKLVSLLGLPGRDGVRPGSAGRLTDVTGDEALGDELGDLAKYLRVNVGQMSGSGGPKRYLLLRAVVPICQMTCAQVYRH